MGIWDGGYGLGVGGDSWEDWDADNTPGTAEAPIGSPDALLTDLTEKQRIAVEAAQAPLLVLAGAGTGKTKVLTTRIGYWIRRGEFAASQILALTFTRKAAAEMARRLEAMIGPSARAMDIGTFHATLAKALRACDGAAGTGVRPDFTMLDDGDQKDVLKRAATAISEEYAADLFKRNKVRDILGDISAWRMTRIEGADPFTNPRGITSFEDLANAYRDEKARANVLDFDDVLHTFDQMLDDARLRRMFQMRWRMILVDEFQDTDPVQYSILTKLASRHRNLTCVGDDDQSIYSWRGAQVSNILHFKEHWVEAAIVRLEDNFRSTADILDHANALIGRNRLRHGKTLSSTRGPGMPVEFAGHKNAFDEAREVSRNIVADMHAGVPLTDIAVICRVAAGLGEVQRQLIADGIRYTMHAGSSVADKVETKLVAAWIRMAVNQRDEAAFSYAFSDAPRAVGKATLARLREDARATDTTVEQLLRQNHRDRTQTKYAALHDFLDDIAEIRALARLGEAPRAIVEEIIERSGIRNKIAKEREQASNATTKDDQEGLAQKAGAREQNLLLLLEHADAVENLADLAANIILANEKTSDDGEAAWLGTIHAAKSLEWRSVYLVGFEAGIIPSPRHCEDRTSADYEEERNLGYVAITRARDRLRISWADQRTTYGTQQSGGPSEFIEGLAGAAGIT
jgi:DNA helicase-2/ATP-dependent DNA helicase PcrA